MDYQVIRSKRKTLALEISPQLDVLVRAPQRLPKAQIDAFVLAHQAWIAAALARMQTRVAAQPNPDPAQLALLRQEALDVIPTRVAYYSEKMGLHPKSVCINAAKGRFGSCSGVNRLNFSCLLMAYPPEAIDYVVVHELAHMQHKNHSKDFYALIAVYLPDWPARRALLRAENFGKKDATL